MEELTKKDILTLLGENTTEIRHDGYKGFDESEMDEMARTQYKIDKKTGQQVLDKKWPSKPTWGHEPERKGENFQRFKPMYSPPYPTADEKEPREHVGWYYFSAVGAEPIPLIFTCEWEELVGREPNLVPMLQEKYGSVKLINDNCGTDIPRSLSTGTMMKAGPIPGEEGDTIDVEKVVHTPGRNKETGDVTTTPTRTKILTVLNSSLKVFSANPEVVNILKNLSLPPIVTDNNQNISNKNRIHPHRNSNSTVNNENIEFESHSIQTYPTQEEFLRHTSAALRTPADKIETVPTYAIRRKITKRTRSWNPLIFTSDKNYGKTPVLNLNGYDFPENEFEVMVMSEIKISGKAIQKNQEHEVERWEWSLKYDVNYAKKLPGEGQATKLQNDYQVVKRVVVGLEQPQKFDGKTEFKGNTITIDRDNSDFGSNHPLTNDKIKNGLDELLEQFKTELMGTNKNLSMQRALAAKGDEGSSVFRQQPSLNENEIKKLVHKVMKS